MRTLENKIAVPIERALSRKKTFVDALFERPESLAALLPYDEFIPHLGMFRQKDGSLGVVLEATLLEHEAMTGDQIMEAVSSLKSWFNLPSNCTLQVLFDQGFVSALDASFEQMKKRYKSAHTVSETLFRSRLDAIQASCQDNLPLSPLGRKLYLSVRYYPQTERARNPKTLMRRGEAVLYSEVKEFVKESRAFSQIVANLVQNSKIPLKQLGAEELVDVLRRFFNPATYYKRSFAKFNPNLPISNQVLYHSPTLSFTGIEREGMKTRTLTLKTSPHFAYSGGMAYFLKLGFPFKLSLNFKFPTKKQVKTFFDLKEFFLQNTPSAKARRQREEVLQVQEKLAREDRCLHLTFCVILEGRTDEELDGYVREVANIFHNDLECEVIVEEDIGLGLCLNALPLNYSVQTDHSTQRYIRILRSDVVHFLPVFDSYRGLKTPLSVHLSRERNLIRFSLLENETSNHTVVLADSGSGKSAFVIDCIQSLKRMDPEPLVFVIDKKSSYPMMCEYFDGDLTVFDRSQEMPFTPFRGIYDDEKFAFLTRLLITGVRLTSPSFELDSLHDSAINRTLRNSYEKKVNQAGLAYENGELVESKDQAEIELSMEDLVSELASLTAEKEFENFGSGIEALLQRLMPFMGDGIYAKYFRGKQGAESGKKARRLFYVYDLDALSSDPTLQALITMAVIEEIRRLIKLPENQGRGGFIVLEELGMLGRDNPTAKQFIIDAAETFRKLGVWLIGLTPRPQNFVELEVGRAMWSVANNFIFLQMNPDNVEYLAEHSKLLDSASKEIIKSLRTKRGQYADVFYLNKEKTAQGAFRYFQTPLDRWLAPTNAKDFKEATKALKKFSRNKWQALTYLASKYPNGVETFENEQVTEEQGIPAPSERSSHDAKS